jgi:hypothetical protein
LDVQHEASSNWLVLSVQGDLNIMDLWHMKNINGSWMAPPLLKTIVLVTKGMQISFLLGPLLEEVQLLIVYVLFHASFQGALSH